MIYEIYSYKIKSNIILENFTCSKNQTLFDINIEFNIGNTEYKKYCDCVVMRDYYILNMYKIIYVINKLGNEMKVYCNDLEYFYSSCYNVPFSIISYINKSLLLHSSAIEIDNRIIAFCGKKENGKTTLVSYLSKYFNFYTDDTMELSINENLCLCERSFSPLKMNEDSLNILTEKTELFAVSRKNVSNKSYINPSEIKLKISEKNKLPLDKIIFLNRNKDRNSEIIIRKIEDNITIHSLLLTNIVGSKFFPYEIISDYVNFEIYKYLINKINFYILDYPSDLDKLENIRYILEEII